MQRLGLVTDGANYDLNHPSDREIYLDRIAFVALELDGPVWIREKKLMFQAYTDLVTNVTKRISERRNVNSNGAECLFINYPKLFEHPAVLKRMVQYGEHFGVRVGCHFDGIALKDTSKLVCINTLRHGVSFPVHGMDELEQVIHLKSIYGAVGQPWHIIISPLFYTTCKPVAKPYADDLAALKKMTKEALEAGLIPWFLGGVNGETLKSICLDFSNGTGGFLSQSLGMIKDAERIEPELKNMLNEIQKR